MSRDNPSLCFHVALGTNSFSSVLKEERRLLCHHAADVTNYKSADFDICRAVSNNTLGVREVLKALAAQSNSALLLTGSVFEAGEGAGSEDLPSFSPYGVSKSLTSDIFSYYCVCFDYGWEIRNPKSFWPV